MPRIFISYRRTDSIEISGRIYDRLEAEFGEDSIFKDVDDIPLGQDFRSVIADAISKSDVMLVIIGKNWIDAPEPDGTRRLDNANDPVRFEVETGLAEKGLLVIPVLVGGAPMPGSADLPEAMRELAYSNAAVVRNDPDFRRDMARLLDDLNLLRRQETVIQEREKAAAQQATRRTLTIAGGVGALLILVFLLLVANGTIRFGEQNLELDIEGTANARLTLTAIAFLATDTPDAEASVNAIMTGFVTQTQAALQTREAFTVTPSNTPTDAPTATETPAPPTPTNTPSRTPSPTPNRTQTAEYAAAVEAQGTSIVESTAIAAETNAALSTQNAPTNTPRPTTTSTATASATATETNTPTSTATFTPTLTPDPTATNPPTHTPTPNLTRTAIAEATSIEEARQDALATQNALSQSQQNPQSQEISPSPSTPLAESIFAERNPRWPVLLVQQDSNFQRIDEELANATFCGVTSVPNTGVSATGYPLTFGSANYSFVFIIRIESWIGYASIDVLLSAFDNGDCDVLYVQPEQLNQISEKSWKVIDLLQPNGKAYNNQQFSVEAETANLRSAPSGDFDNIINTVARGIRCEVLAHAGADWYLVYCDTAGMGWLNGSVGSVKHYNSP